MKKLLMASLCAILSVGAFADEAPVPVEPKPTEEADNQHKHHHMKMPEFTEEQKACIESFGCKIPEKPEFKGKPEDLKDKPKPDFKNKPADFKDGEKPDFNKKDGKKHGPKHEMSQEEKENMECLKKAMPECGIEMPKKPEGKPKKPENPQGPKE